MLECLNACVIIKGVEVLLTPNACGLDNATLDHFAVRAMENAMGVAMTNYASTPAWHDVRLSLSLSLALSLSLSLPLSLSPTLTPLPPDACSAVAPPWCPISAFIFTPLDVI